MLVLLFVIFAFDDCVLAAHSLEDAKAITDCFAQAAAQFGLTVSVKRPRLSNKPAPVVWHPVAALPSTVPR